MCFSFNDTPTTKIYTLSLHDALPISRLCLPAGMTTPWYPMLARWSVTGDPSRVARQYLCGVTLRTRNPSASDSTRSEEHTSELQSQSNLVCRLLLEKKNSMNGTQ